LKAALSVLAVGATLAIGASRAEANHDGPGKGGFGFGGGFGGGYGGGYFPGKPGYFPRPYPPYGGWYPHYPWPYPYHYPKGPYFGPGPIGYGGGFGGPYRVR
jgi:hypothetical protein